MTDDIVIRLRAIHCAADDLKLCECLPCRAADEIERLRRWQKWGLHVFVCHIKGKVCWNCLSPDYQDQAVEIGTAQMIKLDTRRNGGFYD
jgi:hypothetical protein